MIRSQTKRSIFSWVWRFTGVTILIPIIGELENNLTQAGNSLEFIVSAFLSLIVGFLQYSPRLSRTDGVHQARHP